MVGDRCRAGCPHSLRTCWPEGPFLNTGDLTILNVILIFILLRKMLMEKCALPHLPA